MNIRIPTTFTPKTLAIATCAAMFMSMTTFAADLKTDDAKASYSIGASVGKHISSQIYTQVGLGAQVDVDLVVTGFVDALKAKSQLNDDEILTALNQRVELLNTVRAANAKKLSDDNTKAGEAYLASNKKKSGVKVTASGLQYEVLVKGEGNTPKAEDVVTVEYVGKLIDGTEFENTVGREEP
ncbi:MAG: FKBP-type peptidyl-prolyl cis-trans isomerase N-terminal domain-containing protein, partial [Shewanella sp.]